MTVRSEPSLQRYSERRRQASARPLQMLTCKRKAERVACSGAPPTSHPASCHPFWSWSPELHHLERLRNTSFGNVESARQRSFPHSFPSSVRLGDVSKSHEGSRVFSLSSWLKAPDCRRPHSSRVCTNSTRSDPEVLDLDELAPGVVVLLQSHEHLSASSPCLCSTFPND